MWKDKVKEYKRAYYLTHKDKISIQSKANYIAHRQERLAHVKTYRDAHREETLARHKAYYHAHREERSSSELILNYGISKADRDMLLFAQNGTCAICGKDNWGKNSPHVDHDHVTGKIRGILCARCNVALGMIGDDPKVAQSIITYLENYRSCEEARLT
jgi:hypothetical protein